jgi:hypothetical protein
MITGSPFSPLSADVSAYKHPAAKLIVPPPAAFTALTAATKAAWPAHGTLTLEGPARAAVAGVIQNASKPAVEPNANFPRVESPMIFPRPKPLRLARNVSRTSATVKPGTPDGEISTRTARLNGGTCRVVRVVLPLRERRRCSS